MNTRRMSYLATSSVPKYDLFVFFFVFAFDHSPYWEKYILIFFAVLILWTKVLQN
jgi:hypothetical protein